MRKNLYLKIKIFHFDNYVTEQQDSESVIRESKHRDGTKKYENQQKLYLVMGRYKNKNIFYINLLLH